MSFRSAWTDHNYALRRARRASSGAALPPKRQGAPARLHHITRRWRGIVSRRWHVVPQARTEGTGPPPAQCPSKGYALATNREARRAPAASSRNSPPLQRQRAPARLRGVTRDAGLALEAAVARHITGARRIKTGLSVAQYRCLQYGPTTTSASRRTPLATLSAAPSLWRLRAPARLLRGVTRDAHLAL